MVCLQGMQKCLHQMKCHLLSVTLQSLCCHGLIPSAVSIPCAGSASTNLHSLRLNCLSDEELQALEGTERENVELRIGVLRNIQLLLDSAVSQMNQYHAVTGQ